jgi:hypothetical protein
MNKEAIASRGQTLQMRKVAYNILHEMFNCLKVSCSQIAPECLAILVNRDTNYEIRISEDGLWFEITDFENRNIRKISTEFPNHLLKHLNLNQNPY